MNRTVKKSIWVLALGIAFTGFSAPSVAAAVPAQQGDEHDRNRDRDHHNDQNGEGGWYQQGLRDGQSDRHTGRGRGDHQQPSDQNDLRAYYDGYRHGFRNIPSSSQYGQSDRHYNRGGSDSWFQQGVRDGQSDRHTGRGRSDHQQPSDPNELRSYYAGYKQGFRNTGGGYR